MTIAKEYENLTVAQVREFMRKTHEDQYQLIDVRQPDEYREDHLPGAILIPVGEIEQRIAEIAPDKACIVYCLSGRRSEIASVFIGSNPTFNNRVYNMLGGFLAWDGHYIPDMPNLKLFEISSDEATLLYHAMNLEKGAHRFYQLVLDQFETAALSEVMNILVNAEVGHAKMIYAYWALTQTHPASFEAIYETLPGDILEDGQSLETLTNRLKQRETKCLDIIEMAMSIEYSAYDLYRNVAHMYRDTRMAKTFLLLCESEKKHMRIASEALALCTG